MDESSYPPSAAHVATDDKALLARLNGMASHPPRDSANYHQESSAPVWEDEDVVDSDASSSLGDPSGSSSSQVFPPPSVPVSSKGKMAAEYYDYSYSLFDDDIESLEPELGPSAPPFEAVPPLPSDDSAVVPSAPVLDDFAGDRTPSAPFQAVDESIVVYPPHYHS